MVQICTVFHSQPFSCDISPLVSSHSVEDISKFVNKMDNRISMTVSTRATQAIAMMPPPRLCVVHLFNKV